MYTGTPATFTLLLLRARRYPLRGERFFFAKQRRLRTNVECFSKITSRRITFSLSAMNYEPILKITLQRLIDRNCPKVSGLAILEIKAINVRIISSDESSPLSTLMIIQVTSSPHKPQCLWEPSGRRAFVRNFEIVLFILFFTVTCIELGIHLAINPFRYVRQNLFHTNGSFRGI